MSTPRLRSHGSHPYPRTAEKIAACRPDLLVLTGDIFDEFTEPEELEAFCSLFGEIDAPLGKYYVLGNHDLFHHWREPSFGRADLEQGLAKAGVRLLEDTGVMLPCGVRIVGPQRLFVYEWPAFYCRPVDSRRTGRPLYCLAGPRAAGL